MKRTFLSTLVLGSSLALLAQTTPPATSTTTTQPVTNLPTTNSSTTNNSVTNSTTDPVNTVTNQQAISTSAYPPSTSWDATGTPYWGWNSYGIWNNSPALQSTTGTSATTLTSNTAVTPNNSVTSNTAVSSDPSASTTSIGMYNSSGSYNAYNGTAVTSLPYNVQTSFTKDYSNPDNRQYAWNQYGDWFSTYYTNKGRATQYYYDQRGNGYSLSLPVIQTYVPEDIVDKALNKYGSQLYSISMIKTSDGSSAYQVGLINHGQLHSEYLNEGGATVANVWRTEEMNMTSNSANAAMDSQSPANNNASTDLSNVTTDQNNFQDTTGKGRMKTRMKNGDGTTTVTKTKNNGTMKTKTKGHKHNADSTMNPSGMKEK